MASVGGLLSECVQHLRNSSHDYEKLLGGTVDSVWRAISTTVERQLRLRKGVGVPSLGKFALVRDLEPATPVFVLADRFTSSYGVAWRRPPPALLTPGADMSLAVVGNDAGGIPKDQAAKTLDAIIAYLGSRLQKGTAIGKVRLGVVGAFVFEGKSIVFQFDPIFVSQLSRKASPHGSDAGTWSKHDKATTAVIPRALSLQTLAPVSKLVLMTGPSQPVGRSVATEQVDEDASVVDEKRSHRKHHHHKSHHRSRGFDKERNAASRDDADAATAVPVESLHRHHQSKSTGQLKLMAGDMDSPAGQILPRFMLNDVSKSPTKRVYEQQAAAVQRAFECKQEELQHKLAQTAQENEEIDRRSKATRLRCVQERAQKTIEQRDLDAFLSSQIEWKHQEKQRLHALDASSTNYDGVRLLPRDRIVTKEQRRLAKDKLRGHLHNQVTLKDTLAKQRHDIERAESEYFMAKFNEVAKRERDDRQELQRITREALTAGWKQQRNIIEQSATLEPKRRPRERGV